LAHFISRTTYTDLKAESSLSAQDTESLEDNPHRSDSYAKENEKKNGVKPDKKWLPTEKIIKMWVEKKGQEHEDPELRSDLSVQRMRASVTADSLVLCLRLGQEEYY
jgi:hypothetical protein